MWRIIFKDGEEDTTTCMWEMTEIKMEKENEILVIVWTP